MNGSVSTDGGVGLRVVGSMFGESGQDRARQGGDERVKMLSCDCDELLDRMEISALHR